MNAPPRLRFAPSPTGRLHLGHAFSALLNDRVARRFGGTWLLRIEDIDPIRATRENAAGIEEDLAWLGLGWPRPVRRQSEQMDAYRAAADRLRGRGLLYPCTCTRGEIASEVAAVEARSGRPWPRDPDGGPLYPGTCRRHPGEAARRIAAGLPHAWRLDLSAALAESGPLAWTRFDPESGDAASVAARPERWGDVVLVRKEVATSYHLSVVHDDSHQGISHVVRGQDMEAATDIHALLFALLGLPAPRYHHHGLLTDPHGAKLAKSSGSESLQALREAGLTAAAIRARLGFGPADGPGLSAPR